MILKIEKPENFSSEDEKIIMLCISILKNMGAVEISENSTIAKATISNINVQEITDLFNYICGKKLPKISYISSSRRSAIQSLLKKFTIEQIKTAFKSVVKSDFLTGNNARNWKATFDWIIKETNIAKILDGNYENKESAEQSFAAYDLDLYEKMINSD